MITNDSNRMALTNYEKQKRWREKNRALYNLQQRNRRGRKMGSVSVEEESRERVSEETGDPRRRMINELREKIAAESAKPVEANVVQLVYRDDYGRVISERAYRALQKLKESAKNGGYELDEYSQF